MYAYQDNKIFLGQNRIVTAISYDPNTELFALGFETGSIKILKLEEKPNNDSNQLEIVINENLNDTHQNPIKTLSWNISYEKLLSVDQQGLMIVWTENEETYEEEMINESESDQIMFAQWSKKGQYILIIFASGNIILGNVEGERLWSKTLKFNIKFFDWLEKDETIVLTDNKGELLAIETISSESFAEFDVSQEQLKTSDQNIKKTIKREDTQSFISSNKDREVSTTVTFFQGNTLQEEESRLVVAYETGEVYIIMNLRECDMKKFAFGFDQIINGIWNKEGDMFMLQTMTRGINGMYLLDQNGQIQICFENPKIATQMEFIQNSSKFISIHQNMMYLMRIKKDYKCCYLQSKSIFVIALKKNKTDTVLFFYQIIKKQIKKKIVKNFINLFSNDQNMFVIICQNNLVKKQEAFLVNHQGAFLQSLILVFNPIHYTFKNSKILFYSNGNVILWDIELPLTMNTKLTYSGRKIFFFDLRDKKSVKDITQFPEFDFPIQDEFTSYIESIFVTRNLIYLCNEKGYIRRFCVKTFQEQTPVMLNIRPMKIHVNQQESHMAIVDFEKNLLIKYIGDQSDEKKEIFNQTQVWEFYWADNGCDFFYIRKDRIFQKSLNSENPEEKPNDEDGIKTDIFFVGVTFPNLILFDIELFVKIIKDFNLENYKSFDFVKIKPLASIQKITEEIESKENITFEQLVQNYKKDDKDVVKYIADQFLLKNNYEEAEKAYRFINNYSSLKFIQRIKEGLQNEMYKQAEKFIYLNQVDKASELLLMNNKENLLIKLLQDYELYEELIQYEHLLDQETLKDVYNKLGEQQMQKSIYLKAIKWFEKTNNIPKLIELYCLNEDYEKLISLCENEKNKENIKILVSYLLQNNFIELSAKMLEKLAQGKKAVDVAILHNYWGTAVEISEKNNFHQIDNVLNKFATILIEKNQKMDVVQLYRKAKKNLEAAKMLSQIADDLIKKNNSALLVKKIYVLSALEINLEKQKRFNPNLTSNLTNITLTDQSRNNTMNTLNTLITSDVTMAADKILINPWKGAEAWHLYLIALKYLSNRQYLEGYITSQKLISYELELGAKRIYSLGAIFAKKLGLLKQYSKNLSKLQHYAKENKDILLLNQLERICISSFKSQEPIDQELEQIKEFTCIGKGCDKMITHFDSFCKSCGANFGICMASGKGVFTRDYIKCKICKHKLLSEEIKKRNLVHCSLCHQKLDMEQPKQVNKQLQQFIKQKHQPVHLYLLKSTNICCLKTKCRKSNNLICFQCEI